MVTGDTRTRLRAPGGAPCRGASSPRWISGSSSSPTCNARPIPCVPSVLATGSVKVSHVLGEKYIAFEEIDDGLWTVFFGPLVLGRFHERRLCIEDPAGYTSRNP